MKETVANKIVIAERDNIAAVIEKEKLQSFMFTEEKSSSEMFTSLRLKISYRQLKLHLLM